MFTPACLIAWLIEGFRLSMCVSMCWLVYFVACSYDSLLVVCVCVCVCSCMLCVSVCFCVFDCVRECMLAYSFVCLSGSVYVYVHV